MNEKKYYKDKNNYLYNKHQFKSSNFYGPYFYGGKYDENLNISGSLLGKNAGYEDRRLDELTNTSKDYEFTGENKFTCVEIEVYQILN